MRVDEIAERYNVHSQTIRRLLLQNAAAIDIADREPRRASAQGVSFDDTEGPAAAPCLRAFRNARSVAMKRSSIGTMRRTASVAG